jgi:hypothetical protein
LLNQAASVAVAIVSIGALLVTSSTVHVCADFGFTLFSFNCLSLAAFPTSLFLFAV